MPEITRDQVKVPADVSADARETYIDNYMAATRGTGRLMLFACDQKVEHLNGDFYGEGIDPADLDPEHLFKIASEGVCGVCAGQRGLVARYAADYPEVNYLVEDQPRENRPGRSLQPAVARPRGCARHARERRECGGPGLHHLPGF